MGGSYEVGPPYTEEVLELMAWRLLKFFDAAGTTPLSFVVFVPDWPGAGGLNLLDGPRFAKFRRTGASRPFLLARGRDHEYISGVQFFVDSGDNANRRYYTVPHGTRAYVLQNDEAARRWAFTTDVESKLIRALEPK